MGAIYKKAYDDVMLGWSTFSAIDSTGSNNVETSKLKLLIFGMESYIANESRIVEF